MATTPPFSTDASPTPQNRDNAPALPALPGVNPPAQQTGVVGTPAPAAMRESVSFLNVKSNAVLDAEASAKAQAEQLLAEDAPRHDLSAFINTRFEEAKNAKSEQTEKIMDGLRRRKGEYSASHLAEIKKQGGSEIFMKLTEAKCNSAEAWFGDIVIPVDGRPWKLTPTPRPNLPWRVWKTVTDQVMRTFMPQPGALNLGDVQSYASTLADMARTELYQEARKRSERMTALIDDQLQEGGFVDAMDEAVSDVVTTGTMVLKGPCVSYRLQLTWADEDFTPDVRLLPMLTFKRVDPLKFFPSPGSTTPQNATYLVEVDEFTRSALLDMKGQDGYSDAMITKVLESRKGTTVALDSTSEQRTLENRTDKGVTDNPDEKFQGKWYTGEIPGYLLDEWGISDVDVEDTYEAICLQIGDEVVHARLNHDPLGNRNYSVGWYKPVKGSFWGQGVPELMSDTQDGCNGIARSIINNLAVGSGPQVAIHNTAALADGTDVTSMYPWKIWQFSDPTMQGRAPITFFQPDVNVDKLLVVFNRFLELADEETGIPKYWAGTPDASGAASTSSGLAMLMNSASRVLKKSIANCDRHVIGPIVTRCYVWNMLYVDDPSIKGDCRVDAQGAMAMFVREQEQVRLHEYMNLTANPTDLRIIGMKGRAKLLRAAGKNLGPVSGEDIVPPDEEIEATLAAEMEGAAVVDQQGMPVGTAPGGQTLPPAAPV